MRRCRRRTEACAKRRRLARRVLSRARGRALTAPSPPSTSLASLTPRGGSPGHPRFAHNPLARATRRAWLSLLAQTLSGDDDADRRSLARLALHLAEPS